MASDDDKSIGSWNTPEELQERLPETINVEETTLIKSLEKAHRKVTREVGKAIYERIRPDYEDQRKWDLRFQDIWTVEHVQYFDETISSDNYTVDKTAGTIEFTTAYRDDKLTRLQEWRVTIKYTPMDVVDLEMDYAILYYLKYSIAQISNEEEINRIGTLREMIEEEVKSINKHAPEIDADVGKQLGPNQRTTYSR